MTCVAPSSRASSPPSSAEGLAPIESRSVWSCSGRCKGYLPMSTSAPALTVISWQSTSYTMPSTSLLHRQSVQYSSLERTECIHGEGIRKHLIAGDDVRVEQHGDFFVLGGSGGRGGGWRKRVRVTWGGEPGYVHFSMKNNWTLENKCDQSISYRPVTCRYSADRLLPFSNFLNF